ncbi:MAG: phosphomannomutase/phosphoglucomutase [Chlamydiae bacterium]|nr:phosphomannomutase/phosphoglucomutase [Chlamydiota bacterium]MBI3277536.1 phosphomannomutase/phosphoglucomutase [Chlamydiota bacterium]
MAGIFKAYDIRGIYPTQINEEIAYKIGYAISKVFEKGTVAVGRDMRTSSLSLFQHLTSGLNDGGVDVIDVGLISTPMINFTTAHYQYDGGVMITASHNSKEYNGVKLCRWGAYPVSYKTGIAEIEKKVQFLKKIEPAPKKGKIYTKDVIDDYVQHVLKFAKKIKKLKIVVDAGNGMGGLIAPKLLDFFPCEVIPLYFELDGTFPHHDANPLEPENMRDLQKAVLEHKADLGAAFDGDADRVMFVDNEGKIVSADVATALIAKEFLECHPGETVLYDLRSSWIVKEEIEKYGGKAQMCRVGHAFIKQALREANGIFAGELSGHYYFRDNFFADSAAIAFVMMLNVLSKDGKSFASRIKPLKRYASTGELNSKVKDPDSLMSQIEKKFSGGRVFHLDGLSIEFKDWWFNLRKSNTEPLLRLNVEAKTPELLKEKSGEILGMIKAGHR